MKKIMNVVIFGTGMMSKDTIQYILKSEHHLVAIVDNDADKWGNCIEGIQIISPQEVIKLEYDVILICSTIYYHEILEQLVSDLQIPIEKIHDYSYFFRKELLEYYEFHPEELKQDMLEPLSYIKSHCGIKTFNYNFTEKAMERLIEVEFDQNIGLYYAIYHGKKLYMKRSYNSEEKTRRYCQKLLMEQDVNSPHRYLDECFTVEDGSTVLDAGVAEGNFALEVIDKIKHIYLIECDTDWLEALEHTFKPYKNKVTIINKYLSDICDEKNITIDSIAQERHLDFIKLDIEGGEIRALEGAANFFKHHVDIKMVACAYHNISDEEKITKYLHQWKFETYTSKGYMTYISSKLEPIRFVRGLVKGEKTVEKAGVSL